MLCLILMIIRLPDLSDYSWNCSLMLLLHVLHDSLWSEQWSWSLMCKIKWMLIPRLYSASNILEAAPLLDIIPAPTIDTIPTSFITDNIFVICFIKCFSFNVSTAWSASSVLQREISLFSPSDGLKDQFHVDFSSAMAPKLLLRFLAGFDSFDCDQCNFRVRLNTAK